MKLKQTLIFEELDGETIIVPVGEAAEVLHGMMKVNATGAAIIRSLSDGLDEEDAAVQLVERFDGVDMEQARKAVGETVEKLRTIGLVDD